MLLRLSSPAGPCPCTSSCSALAGAHCCVEQLVRLLHALAPLLLLPEHQTGSKGSVPGRPRVLTAKTLGATAGLHMCGAAGGTDFDLAHKYVMKQEHTWCLA
jgi:hypothetical protein